MVAADARRWFKAFTANTAQGLGLGFISAWAGDEDLLGHEALVARTLSKQLREGRLRSSDGISKSGAAFVAGLQRFLRRTGYSR